jgi:actin beta/gamma 1
MSEDPIVIDNGSSTCKVGYAGDDAPRAVFPSVFGVPIEKKILIGIQSTETFVGDEARAKRGILNLKYPIEHGIITDWEDMTKIWHHAFYDELRIKPEEHPVLLTEPPLNPRFNREKTTQIMFDNFDVPALHLSASAILSLCASGRTTGLVIDSGDGVTSIVPVYESSVLEHAAWNMPLAGRDLSFYLMMLLRERGISIYAADERDIVRVIKEAFSYVPLDFNNEVEKFANDPTSFDKHFELPDGNVIAIGEERFRCPEALFDPSVCGIDSEGIHTLTYNCIMKTDVDVQKEMFSNIMMAGGTTMIHGMRERISKEIINIVPGSMNVTLRAPPDRCYSTWIGGSIIASLSTFSEQYITKSEYEEYGSKIVHRKCF